jgi:hypothetical protein
MGAREQKPLIVGKNNGFVKDEGFCTVLAVPPPKQQK